MEKREEERSLVKTQITKDLHFLSHTFFPRCLIVFSLFFLIPLSVLSPFPSTCFHWYFPSILILLSIPCIPFFFISNHSLSSASFIPFCSHKTVSMSEGDRSIDVEATQQSCLLVSSLVLFLSESSFCSSLSLIRTHSPSTHFSSLNGISFPSTSLADEEGGGDKLRQDLSSAEIKARSYYLSCLDKNDTIESRGAEPLKSFIREVISLLLSFCGRRNPLPAQARISKAINQTHNYNTLFSLHLSLYTFFYVHAMSILGRLEDGTYRENSMKQNGVSNEASRYCTTSTIEEEDSFRGQLERMNEILPTIPFRLINLDSFFPHESIT